MRRAMGILGAVIGIAALLGAALWFALRINAPAVLDTIDRLTGESSPARMVAAVSLGDAEAQKLRVFVPGEAPVDPRPVMVFVHGGAWRDGDPDDYSFIARTFARHGYVTVLAGYRKGEAGRYPAMLEDTAAAIRWTRGNIASYGGDPARLFLSGHSAGAYNVAQIALAEDWLHPADRAAIAGVIGLSGPYDFYPFDKPSSKAAFGTVGAGSDSQPINHIGADAPPMLLVHGESDEVVRPRNTRVLAAALEKAGAEVETMVVAGWSHNDPLLALAAPWRTRRGVERRILGFMAKRREVSVPVQPAKP